MQEKLGSQITHIFSAVDGKFLPQNRKISIADR